MALLWPYFLHPGYDASTTRKLPCCQQLEVTYQQGPKKGGDDVMTWRPGMPTPKKDEPGLRKGERYLLKNFSGVVKSGEMMLVLGLPGSGCSTFLKVLAGHRDGYAGVEGDVKYGSLQPGKDFRPYKSEVIFISEEDLHDPNLLVGHTMDFALRMCTPSRNSRLPENQAGNAMGRNEYQDRTKEEMRSEIAKLIGHSTSTPPPTEKSLHVVGF